MNLLVLELKLSDHEIGLELKPGQKITFGRSKSADIFIDSKSVSSLHLEFEWTGTIVKLRDLDSRFGSFIEDEKEAFRERQFTPLDTHIKVKMGKSLLEMKWKAEQMPLEKTEVIEEKTSQSRTLKKTTTKVVFADEKSTYVSKKIVNKKAFSASWWSFSASSLGIVTFLRFFFWPKALHPLWDLDPFMMLGGASIDLMFFHRIMLDRFILLFIGVLALPWILPKLLKNKVLPDYMDWSYFLAKTPFRILSYGLVVIVIFLPSFSALSRGNLSWPKIAEVNEFYNLYKSNKLNLISTDKWNTHSENLIGSSFVFGQYFNFRIEKVRNECARQDLSDWEKQKLCVALFFAASVETAGQLKPAYLFEMANRIALIAAIDGVIRVVRQEGRSTDSMSLYLETLGNMGLSQEKEELLELLRNQNVNDDKLLSSLFVLRRELDTRLMVRQIERSVPEFMRLKATDLLNIGY